MMSNVINVDINSFTHQTNGIIIERRKGLDAWVIVCLHTALTHV